MKPKISLSTVLTSREMAVSILVLGITAAAVLAFDKGLWVAVLAMGLAGLATTGAVVTGWRTILSMVTQNMDKILAGNVDLDVPKDLPEELRPVKERVEALVKLLRSGRGLALFGPKLLPQDIKIWFATAAETAQTVETAISAMELAAQQLAKSMADVGTNLDDLSANAEESSSSVLEMAAANDEIAENMFTLSASVEEAAQAIGQMTSAIKDLAAHVDQVAAAAEETSASMNEIDVSIRQVENLAAETAKLSGNAAQRANRGAESVRKTISGIQVIRDSTRQTVDIIADLVNKIGEIGKILTVIDDVSDQTNLLALNAAIIAAQAGEHGKAFAVVADEIKDLAERSTSSTREIADLIRAVQAASDNAIAVVQQSAKAVDEGVKVSKEAEQALAEILESIDKATTMIQQIAQATVEQALGTRRATAAVSTTAEQVQRMSQSISDNAGSADKVLQNVEKIRAITQHVERSTQEQSRGNQQMTRAVESITQRITEIALSHRDQRSVLKSLTEETEKLANVARRASDMIERLPFDPKSLA